MYNISRINSSIMVDNFEKTKSPLMLTEEILESFLDSQGEKENYNKDALERTKQNVRNLLRGMYSSPGAPGMFIQQIRKEILSLGAMDEGGFKRIFPSSTIN